MATFLRIPKDFLLNNKAIKCFIEKVKQSSGIFQSHKWSERSEYVSLSDLGDAVTS